MNLRTFVVGVFTHGMSSIFGKQLDTVRASGRRDADLVGGAYLDAFDGRMRELLADRQQRLIGVEPRRKRLR